jgi:hypothetical protein
MFTLDEPVVNQTPQITTSQTFVGEVTQLVKPYKEDPYHGQINT